MAQNNNTGGTFRLQKGNKAQAPSASAPVSTVNSSTSSPAPHSRKRRKRRTKDGAAMQGLVPPSSAESGFQASFGKNRLAGGFARSHSSPDLASSDEARALRQPAANGNSQQNAIELSDSSSDDETAHSDGGMAVNIVASGDSESDHWMEEELKRLSEQPPAKPDTPVEAKKPEPASSGSGPPLRLADLNADDFEDQLRYGLYHLQRHQIDLSRPVTCLACLREGHMADTCPETHCSDCPDVDESAAVARWSLKALDPSQIINLSLQTGTRDREREAESRVHQAARRATTTAITLPLPVAAVIAGMRPTPLAKAARDPQATTGEPSEPSEPSAPPPPE
ncbi:hypothetical protein DV735_g2469, partial [Chaetothyriales sp. CBS 134920]